MAAEKKRMLLFMAGGAVAILGIQAIFGVVMWRVFDGVGGAGTFGHMFGVLNATFSGLAFAGVIYAVVLQSDELRLPREELELTRKELKASAEAQATLARIQNRQEARQHLRNLVAAGAAAVELSTQGLQPHDFADKPTGGKLPESMIGFWRSYSGDIVTAFGPSSHLVSEANVLFEV